MHDATAKKPIFCIDSVKNLVYFLLDDDFSEIWLSSKSLRGTIRQKIGEKVTTSCLIVRSYE